MTLVCFGSVKGSPGVTLTTLLTAAVWQRQDNSGNDRRKVLLEADPDGGALALRYGMPTRPGLLSLAAAAGNSLSRDGLWEHAQSLPGGLPVVVGPPSPDQASVAMRSVGADLGDWLSAAPIDVLADIGRLSPAAPTARFLSSADAVLVVARPTADQLQSAAARMTTLAERLQIGWILIGERPYRPEDVAEAFDFPVVAVLPDDNKVASAVVDGADPAKLRRATLLREVRRMAGSLSTWLDTIAATQPDAAPEQVRNESPVSRSTSTPPTTTATVRSGPP